MNRDFIAEKQLEKALFSCDFFHRLLCFDTVTSTNDVAKELAQNGASEGTVVLAAGQTAGRGRMSRTFYSPAGDGLYMSFILRPAQGVDSAGLITACAAVAVRRAIARLTDVAVDIKWVNDLQYHGKKLCGILAEGQFSDDGRLSYMILGIGLNLRPPKDGYVEEIRGKTTSLEELAPDKRMEVPACAVAILESFSALYEGLPERAFLEEYRSASCLMGEKISYLQGDDACFGRVLGIDDAARLLVLQEDGRTVALSAGEVNLIRTVGAL